YLRRLQRAYVLAVARTVYDADPALRSAGWKDLKEGLGKRLDELRLYLPAPREGPGEGGDGWEALRRPLYVVGEKILGPGEPLPGDWETHGKIGRAHV